MTVIMRDLVARLPGVEFFGQATHHASRFGFAIRGGGLAGVFDGVDQRYREAERPSSAGSFEGPSTDSSRSISILGSAIAPDQRSLLQMRDQLAGLFWDGGAKPLEVDHATETRRIMVRLAEKPGFVPLFHTPRADYELHLWAPDPFFYGETRRLGSTVWHRGNRAAYPTVVVRADVAMPQGYGLRMLDKAGAPRGFLRIKSLAAGQRHVIDMRTGVVRLGGVLAKAVHSGAPFAVPPYGEFTLRVEPNVGVGRGSIESVDITDTWV